jgi:hypothetical protein
MIVNGFHNVFRLIQADPWYYLPVFIGTCFLIYAAMCLFEWLHGQ